MTRRAELLAAVLADFTPERCSVYADHLLELGDPRGEFIACDVALAGAPDDDRRRSLRRRRRELLQAHAGGWFPWSFVLQPADEPQVNHGTRLGFVHKVQLQRDSPRLAEVLEREPIRDLRIYTYDEARLPAEVLRCAGPARLEVLQALLLFDQAGLAELIVWPELTRLRELEVRVGEVDFAGLPDGLPALRSLCLTGDLSPPATAASLAGWAPLARLERLELRLCQLTPASLATFCAAGPFPRLTELRLEHNRLGPGGGRVLERHAASFPALRRLSALDYTLDLDDRTALRDAAWPAGPLEALEI